MRLNDRLTAGYVCPRRPWNIRSVEWHAAAGWRGIIGNAVAID